MCGTSLCAAVIYHFLPYPSSIVMVDLSRILRRPQQQARRVYDKPARERHFLSIICSVLSSIFLIMALALKVWASGSSEQCSYVFGLTQVYMVRISDQKTTSKTSKPSLQIGFVYEMPDTPPPPAQNEVSDMI